MPRRRKRVMRDGPFLRELELVISPTVTIVHGDIIKIDGEHGLRFKFHSLVTNPANGIQWVDCFELEKSRTDRVYVCRAFRSFYPDRVRHIPKKRARRVSRTSTS